jgi:hypothetical protein
MQVNRKALWNIESNRPKSGGLLVESTDTSGSAIQRWKQRRWKSHWK